MALTVVTPATHKEFLLLDTVKTELGITDSTDDGLLVEYILRASDFIVQYTGREFAKEQVKETLASTGRPTMLLQRTPVLSVDAVTLDGTTVDATTYSIKDADAGILWRERGWDSTTIWAQAVEPWPTQYGRLDWAITYTAGYVMPGDPAAATTLPMDLQMACSAIVKAWYHERDENANVVKRSVGEAAETRTFGSEMGGIPQVALSLLKPWRRLV